MNSSSTRPRRFGVTSACLMGALTMGMISPAPAAADDEHSPACHQAPAEPASANTDSGAGTLRIPDTVLIDQDGREVSFAELVEGRVVVMNFVFTTCTTICPPMGANFAKLQQLLGTARAAGELDSDVQLISISVDPAVDTPQRLAAWGEKFGRNPGWTLLTGSKSDVNTVLKALQVFTPLKEDHSPLVLVGDASQQRWTRAYGLAPPAQLVEMVAELSAPAVADHAASTDRPAEGRR